MLNNFITEVKTRGLANPNKYEVRISPPACLSAGRVNDLRLVQLFCDTAQLPDQTISTSQTRTYGEIREMPYENLYGNITMSFYVDSDYKTKFFFDDWIQSVSLTTTRHWNYYNDYISPEITIIMLNNNGAQVYGMTFYECYPKNLQAISIDYASKDLLKCSVSINYKYWRSTLFAQARQISPQLPLPTSSILSNITTPANTATVLTSMADSTVTVVAGAVEANAPNNNGVVAAENTIQNGVNSATSKAKNARDAVNKVLSALPVSGTIQDIRGKASGAVEQLGRVGELGSKIGGLF